jgi:hypothetical protein
MKAAKFDGQQEHATVSIRSSENALVHDAVPLPPLFQLALAIDSTMRATSTASPQLTPGHGLMR